MLLTMLLKKPTKSTRWIFLPLNAVKWRYNWKSMTDPLLHKTKKAWDNSNNKKALHSYADLSREHSKQGIELGAGIK